MTRNLFNQKVDDFINKYINQTVGYPTGQYVGECLSSTKVFMKETFGFNPPSSGVNSAYGYWTNFPAPLGDYFEKIANTPTGVPQKGDTVIWKGALAGSNGFGHIALATGKGDTNSFEAFGQNWGGKHGHHVTYKYTNVYGWLRPKNIDDPETPPPPPVVVPVTDPKDAELDAIRRSLDEVKTQLDEVTKEKQAAENNFEGQAILIQTQENEIGELKKQLDETENETIIGLNKRVKTLEVNLATSEKIKDDLIIEKSDWIKEMKNYDLKYWMIPKEKFIEYLDKVKKIFVKKKGIK